MIRDVVGYEGLYSVSENGKVYGHKGQELTPYDNGYGYLLVDLYRNKQKRHCRVHRLVAEAFLSNPDSLPEVNHKDENKHNNTAENLEWCTSGYNKRYGSGKKARSEGMKRVWEQRRADNEVAEKT